MEAHGSLRMLLNTLLDKETLNSWTIHEEKSGAAVVRIRFSPRYITSEMGPTNAMNMGYKRKSPAQMVRDRERVGTYNERRMTRSQARENGHIDVPDTEKQRCSDESHLSDTCLYGLVSPGKPVVKSRLDPLVQTFRPSAPPLTEEPLSSEPASPPLEPACPSPDLPPSSPLQAAWVDVDGTSLCHRTDTLHINGRVVRTKCSGPDSGKAGCTNHSCMYGGGRGAVDHDFIYDCKQCTGPMSSSICAKCLLNGGTCEPGHNQWELVTWKVHNSYHIVTLYYISEVYHERPNGHFWIPEWRTVFLVFFNWYGIQCMHHGSLQ